MRRLSIICVLLALNTGCGLQASVFGANAINSLVTTFATQFAMTLAEEAGEQLFPDE